MYDGKHLGTPQFTPNFTFLTNNALETETLESLVVQIDHLNFH